MELNTPISALTRVGKTTARTLKRIGVETAGDLLRYFPFRYEDYRGLKPVIALRDGEMATVRVKIELLANKRSWRRRKTVTEALVSDKSGQLRVVWFNQPFITKILKTGDEVFLSGKVKTDIFGNQLVSPVYEKVGAGQTKHTARLVPIYPLTGGLTSKQVRFLVSQILSLAGRTPEWLPLEILERFDLAPLAEALRGIHFPEDETDLRLSTERLKFDELFILQLRAELARRRRKSEKAPALAFREEEIKKFVSRLPFQLTRTQKISAWEILKDIAEPRPMNRLLSGDVGSGKTVVAAIAAYDAVLNGYQVVLMAPTEILARQHFQSFEKMFAGLPISVGLRTRGQIILPGSAEATKKDFLAEIKSGELDIAIGTHALLSDEVKFKKLGLVVVDEQHRFGVEQRKAIKEKGGQAHFLSMTATPIPRSLALMIYGDLDVSIIGEMPVGRKKILTRLVEPANREKAYDFIRQQIKKGRQAFVICPLIEAKPENEEAGFQPINYAVASDKKTVMAEFEKLSKKIFPDLRLGYLHGRLKAEEKEKTMAKFRAGETDILVSTSVVEVGVDIPNASVMMVEGAERFGLAQLHQFRGRVGRSIHQSFCFLFSDSDSPDVLERLKFFEKENDGFKLAEKDLENRGPGEVYGTAQSGLMNLRLAKLTDREIIKKAREAARFVVPAMKKYPALEKIVAARMRQVHLE